MTEFKCEFSGIDQLTELENSWEGKSVHRGLTKSASAG